MFDLDPSKMDPKMLMELSQLLRELPPEKISRMQSLMHNMMAGFDVRKEMEEFENTLPPDFRSKLLAIMKASGGPNAAGSSPRESTVPASEPTTVHEARITVLRAVAEGKVSPEEAERLLFS